MSTMMHLQEFAEIATEDRARVYFRERPGVVIMYVRSRWWRRLLWWFAKADRDILYEICRREVAAGVILKVRPL